MNLRRRAFLVGGALSTGAAVFGGVWAAGAAASESADAARLTASQGWHSFGGWIQLSDQGACTLFVPHIDMGQGVQTALAQWVAEELDLDWTQMRVALAPPDSAFANGALARGWLAGDVAVPAWLDDAADFAFKRIARLRDVQISGGSTAVRYTGQLGLRVVAAATRAALLEAAARRWGVATPGLRTVSGRVIDPGTNRSAEFGELAAEAAGLRLAGRPALKAGGYRIVGTSPMRLDIPDKVTGACQYGIDIVVPGMKAVAVRAAPAHGQRLLGVDAAPAMAVSGVSKVLQLDNAVAVVAETWWNAQHALLQLQPRFDQLPGNAASFAAVSSEGLEVAQRNALEAGDRNKDVRLGNVPEIEQSVIAAGGRLIQASYQVQMLHHAAMEPIAMVASWRDDGLEVWAGVQDPVGVRAALAKAAGISMSRVRLHALPIGGAFGRRLPRSIEPALQQLVDVARRCPHPVKLQWSREEDFAQGRWRPQLMARLQAAVGTDGMPASWRCLYVRKNTEPDAAHIPYRIGAQSIEWVKDPAEVWNVPSGRKRPQTTAPAAAIRRR
jgi:isoquinoline 1-oxidoreductase beta subunit